MIGSVSDFIKNFNHSEVDATQLEQLQTELLNESTLSPAYLILTVGSCIIATLGLITNSTAVIIGAMIIAPLMLPIRGLALGALTGNIILFRRGLIAIVFGTLLSIGLAYALELLVGISIFDTEVLSRSKPTLLDLGIAVTAGSISGYAKVQPKISGSLVGTAIAVALMPPICVMGLGLASSNWSLSQGAALLYFTNLLGITLACMLTFVIIGYSRIQRAGAALFWTLLLTAILLLPLSVSFAQLVKQTNIESSLKNALLTKTITFQRLELLKINTNWLANPPIVRLIVRTRVPVTPKLVGLLEKFVQEEMGQPFTLIFEVSQVEEVTRETPILL
ncbi:hypothetical protein DSM106972_045520 [Dulcicalothrix desertica PCC 7102]|uniref:DUF389 domain-containing protein n=1 Tax=Dulcicalothrix desertica PCC 7102 TaxID=232991 RepID=A0A3S1AM17_9CYAN|nr:DUF389 domain-containing protein [Dulcicalothrix desertica]RUT04324.1 hypothetical protein DSM106972_045520 [Dulcicalothrix desertica PCC 7102]TWH51179.1 putative hydrophobic protein (TIGR00271 family) [Dulcicalothrix desertica PCC 7102]